ncbi:MAG: fasciclin domain-containing protein [Phycisphaerales bacterium JB059]
MKRTVMIGAAAIAALAGTTYAQCGSETSNAGWTPGEAAACEGERAHQAQQVAWEGPKKDLVETAVGAGQFTILAKALTEAGLVEALKGKGPFTVFAPTDEAFKKLPKGTLETLLKPENKDQLVSILTYHVVSGNVLASDVVKLNNAATLNGQRVDITTGSGGVMVDQAKVIATDVKASNGTIHVIDTVMLPEDKDIVGVASEAGSFGTLIAAAKAAGLVPALTGEGPLTVFAPTDEAFAALPPGTVESLLKPENREKLRSILLLHVVEGRVYSEQAAELSEAKTLQGQSVGIKPWDGTLKVGGASVVSADIEASNGVIHVIDRVILPN